MEREWISGAVMGAIVFVLFTTFAVYIQREKASAARGAEELQRTYRLLESGDFAGALPVAANALRESLNDESRALAHGWRGVAYSRLGKYREASGEITAALRLRPRLVFCLIGRGFVHDRLAEEEQALADYRQAIALSPCAFDARRGLALIVARQGHFDEAIAQMKEAVQCQPNDISLLVLLGQIQLAADDLASARAHFDEAIRRDPENVDAFVGRAEIGILEKHPERGLAEVEEAITARPKSARLHFARGIILTEVSRPDLALEDLDFTVRSEPKWAPPLLQRGRAEFWLGNYDRAIADARRAQKLAPQYAAAWSLVGLVRDAENREKEAIAAFDEAIARDSQFSSPIAWRGMAEAHAGACEKARSDLLDATRRFPVSSEVHEARAMFLASCPQSAFRDGPAALSEAQRAVELSHRAAFALDVLAMAHAEVGDFEHAVVMEAAALEKVPVQIRQRRFLVARLHGYEHDQPYRDVR